MNESSYVTSCHAFQGSITTKVYLNTYKGFIMNDLIEYGYINN